MNTNDEDEIADPSEISSNLASLERYGDGNNEDELSISDDSAADDEDEDDDADTTDADEEMLEEYQYESLIDDDNDNDFGNFHQATINEENEDDENDEDDDDCGGGLFVRSKNNTKPISVFQNPHIQELSAAVIEKQPEAEEAEDVKNNKSSQPPRIGIKALNEGQINNIKNSMKKLQLKPSSTNGSMLANYLINSKPRLGDEIKTKEN